MNSSAASGHGLLRRTVLVVLPEKGDAAVAETQQAVVGDRHAMGVAGEIVEHVMGAAEGRLGIHHPLGLRGRGEIGGEGVGVAQRFELRIEVQLTGPERAVQLFEEQPAEEPGQHPHRQEEAGAASDPVLAIGGEAPARHHAVHMGMMQQLLAPGMQDGDEADLGAQVLGIGGDGAQGLGAGVEEQIVERGLVLKGDGRDRLGHGKDDVEILDPVEQLGLAIFEPLRAGERLALGAGAMATTVIGDALMAAAVALLDMATEGGGATAFDGAHGAQLPPAERRGMRLPVSGPAVAEHVRHFEGRGGHRRRSEIGRRGGRRWRGFGPGQQVEGTGGRAHRGGRHLQVARGGGQAAMTHQQLDRAHVGAGFEQVGGESVPQRVRRDRLLDPRYAAGFLAGLLHRRSSDRPARNIAREQPHARDA